MADFNVEQEQQENKLTFNKNASQSTGLLVTPALTFTKNSQTVPLQTVPLKRAESENQQRTGIRDIAQNILQQWYIQLCL